MTLVSNEATDVGVKVEPFACPCCGLRRLRRTIELDPGIGLWSFFCWSCGAMATWDVWVRQWTVA